MSEETQEVTNGVTDEQNQNIVSEAVIVEENPVVQNEANTTEVVETPPQPTPQLTNEERLLYLLELQSIVGMMGAQFMNPQTVGQGEGKPPRLVGGRYEDQYKPTSVYGFGEIITLRKRANELCGKLGINLDYNTK